MDEKPPSAAPTTQHTPSRHTSLSRPSRLTARWIWRATALAIVVVLVVAVGWWRSGEVSDDPRDPNALPENVGYGAGDWTPRGSLSEDAQRLREAAEVLDVDPDQQHGPRVLWAGRASVASVEDAEVVVFGTSLVGHSYNPTLWIVHREEGGDWVQSGSAEREVDSWGRLLIELPFEEMEGFEGEQADRYFLSHDDVQEGSVRTMRGQELSSNGAGVVGVAERETEREGAVTGAFEVSTGEGTSFVSAQITEALDEERWPADIAADVLEFIASGTDGAVPGPGFSDGSVLVTLAEPYEMSFAEGDGAVVLVHQHSPEDEADDVQAAILLHPAAGRPLWAGPAVDGSGDRYAPDSGPAAMALPEGPDGPAVLVTSATGQDGADQRVETRPELPRIAEPNGPGGPAIFAQAPARTAVIWNDDDGEPVRTALVTHDLED